MREDRAIPERSRRTPDPTERERAEHTFALGYDARHARHGCGRLQLRRRFDAMPRHGLTGGKVHLRHHGHRARYRAVSIAILQRRISEHRGDLGSAQSCSSC